MKKSLVFLLFISMFMSIFLYPVQGTTAPRRHDEALLQEILADPTHYYFGHGLGTEASTYVDINTIAVEEYNPPYYVISYDTVQVRGYHRKLSVWKERTRLFYNYDDQEVYEEIYPNGYAEKCLIVPNTPHSSDKEADMVFSIAYNMHFYKNVKFQNPYPNQDYDITINRLLVALGIK
ncbi:MAG: hypothetical protein ACI3U2_02175 [Anaerovibrio sp.]